MSLVTMARKVKAQQGVSKKGFSLNGAYKESGAPRTTVKTSLTSRRNRYNTAVCFGGQEGIQCERVWDGKKEVPKDGGISMAGGDAIRASEYIDRLRYTVARCKNLLFKTDMIGADVKVILVGDNYIIRSNEKNYPVKWYNSTGAIKVLADTGSGDAIIKSISVTGRRTTIIESKVTLGTPTTIYSNTTQATAGIYQESPTTGAQKFGDDELNTLFEVLDQGKEFYIKIDYTDADTLKTNFTNFTDINGDDILEADWIADIVAVPPTNFIIGRSVDINGTPYLQKNLRHFTLKTLSFENPERTIFEPVGCDSISDGSGLGGTAGSDNRGYYGRGSCKVHYVNKDPAFEPKGYDGPGGYLDMIKMPHDDTARYCGN
jgi:hypothetical protein